MAGFEKIAHIDTTRKMEPASFNVQFLQQYTFLERMGR